MLETIERFQHLTHREGLAASAGGLGGLIAGTLYVYNHQPSVPPAVYGLKNEISYLQVQKTALIQPKAVQIWGHHRHSTVEIHAPQREHRLQNISHRIQHDQQKIATLVANSPKPMNAYAEMGIIVGAPVVAAVALAALVNRVRRQTYVRSVGPRIDEIAQREAPRGLDYFTQWLFRQERQREQRRLKIRERQRT